jgi:hypothetical protein
MRTRIAAVGLATVIGVGLAAPAEAGVLVAGQTTATKSSVALAKKWHREWGPAKVYTKKTKWVSRTFTPRGLETRASFKCWDGDGGARTRYRIRIWHESKHKYIEKSSAYKPCSWNTFSVSTKRRSYRRGDALRVVLLKRSGNEPHTVTVWADSR